MQVLFFLFVFLFFFFLFFPIFFFLVFGMSFIFLVECLVYAASVMVMVDNIAPANSFYIYS